MLEVHHSPDIHKELSSELFDSDFCVSPPEQEVPLVVSVKDDVFDRNFERVQDSRIENSKFDKYLMFQAPPTPKGNVIDILNLCLNGSCECTYLFAGKPVQIKPCRVGAAMFCKNVPVSENRWKLFVGVADGFNIVDNSPVPEYDCRKLYS